MDMRHEALRCAEAGLRVHPLYEVNDALVCQCYAKERCDDKARGKHPRLGAWQKVATADVRTVDEWWRQWPNAGIGVATGRASRVWVLDLDGKDAIQWYVQQGKLHGRTPTRGARTGRGRHLWWRWPDGDVEIGNSARQLAQGVDVRGDGGYVVAPPTLHRTGVRYEWLTDGAYVQAPQLAPAWLIELVRKQPKPPPAKVVDIPRRTPWSAKAADEELARRLRLDPYARQRLAEQIGAVVTDQHARRIKCPQCGDTSVWFMLHGTGYAKCSHLNSCGWLGPLTTFLG